MRGDTNTYLVHHEDQKESNHVGGAHHVNTLSNARETVERCIIQLFSCTSIACTMGCGSSSGLGLRPRSRRTAASSGDGKERKLSVRGPVPFINVTFGSNVDKSPPKVIFVFGGPGSHKGRVVGSLQSMFGMKLISSEAIILKFLPQKVGNIVSISTTEEILELVHREPQQVPLDWVMGLVQDEVESEPDHMFIVDLIPNLKWLMKSSSLFKECDTVLKEFERKVPISFALHLSLGEESLDKTLDYSHHSTNLPPGATLADEADNSKAKSRFLMHEKAVQPFVQYFQSCDRLVSVDVSSGASEAIVDRVHQVFTSLNLQAWRPVNTVLVFAMNGLKAGNLDLSVCCDMSLIVLSEITTEPEASAETLLGSLSEHINALADISHYFVIDPSNTTLQKASVGDFHKRALVFSDHEDNEGGGVNKFSTRLNKLVGTRQPYFKAVCSSADETLLFPTSCEDLFCQQMALCMAEKHPSKK